MNEIKGFTFYRNYYELIKYLPNEDRLQLLDAILKYMFNDEETQFDGLLKGMWINIKMPLDSNKTNIINGMKGGAPNGNSNAKKTTQKQPNVQPKNNPKTTERTTQKQANNISYFLFLISNLDFYKDRELLRGKIEEWLKYKNERNELYKEQGFKSLLTQIENKVKQYGEEVVIDLITECMSNNWQGIIWEKLSKNKTSGKENTTTTVRSEITDGGVRFY